MCKVWWTTETSWASPIPNPNPNSAGWRKPPNTLAGFGLDIGNGVSKMSPLSIIPRIRDVIIILAINNRSRRRWTRQRPVSYDIETEVVIICKKTYKPFDFAGWWRVQGRGDALFLADSTVTIAVRNLADIEGLLYAHSNPGRNRTCPDSKGVWVCSLEWPICVGNLLKSVCKPHVIYIHGIRVPCNSGDQKPTQMKWAVLCYRVFGLNYTRMDLL